MPFTWQMLLFWPQRTGAAVTVVMANPGPTIVYDDPIVWPSIAFRRGMRDEMGGRPETGKQSWFITQQAGASCERDEYESSQRRPD